MKTKIKDNLPFILFCFGISFFFLLLTRFFIKTDDGNFLGIANAVDFSYRDFLSYRYNNISGRTISEFLVMFFCRHSVILWKLFAVFLVISVVYFWIKLSSFFNGEFTKNQRCAFCISGIFLMIVSCLNPSVFWFAGSMTYLFTFAGLSAALGPFVFYFYAKKLKPVHLISGIAGTIAASSQEQGAVCCLAMIIVLLCMIKINKLKIRIPFLIQLTLSAFLTFYLFSSPGMKERTISEAQGFEAYTNMNVYQKLLCGLSAFFANTFYLSVALTLILIALLSLSIYKASKNKNCCKKILTAVNLLSFFICIVLNLVCCIIGKGLAHMQIREAFKTSSFSLSTNLLIVFGFVLLITLIGLAIALMRLDFAVGFPTALCLSAGFGCALMMSFSSSIFSSGQRVFFLTNMLIITACVILISSVSKTSLSQKVYRFALFYAATSFIINIFAFSFTELPLMG